MSDRFAGTFDEIKSRLLVIEGEWKQVSEGQFQFRAKSGGFMNWYPSTGSIQFQGKEADRLRLQERVLSIFAAGAASEAETGSTQSSPSEVAASDAVVDSQTKLNRGATGTGSFLQGPFNESELVFGLIAAVGTELDKVRSVLEDRLRVMGYQVTQIRVTRQVIPEIAPLARSASNEYERLKSLMDAGNEARRKSRDNSIVALGAAACIHTSRSLDSEGYPQHEPRRAYIISSLKHPAEVARLREIYPQGFHLIGIHADERRRFDYLTRDKDITQEQADELIKRDQDEDLDYGQNVADTFHLSDFFVRIDGHDDSLKHSLWRILDLLFGNPFVTPTFDEYAMFLAFSASLRSADLSRQVGAVVAVDQQVVATGANDCPKGGGGLYWPEYNAVTHEIEDAKGGRDFMRGEDSNKIEQQKIVNEIVLRGEKLGLERDKLMAALRGSRIGDLTEFGRVVHAEMEALLSCARARVSVKSGVVYTTTFPCHNCAKHIVAAGISRVVFIEPYQKSKAAEFHPDSIQVGFAGAGPQRSGVVLFEPFVGVGPRRFFDLFSMRLGSGYPIKRKDSAGVKRDWRANNGRLRLQMIPISYIDLEMVASNMFLMARDNERRNDDAN